MKGARLYSQVMLLFDRFSALPAASVTQETRALDRQLATRRSQDAGGDEEGRRLWTEVAKLLAKSGTWQHTLAVMDGLPLGLRTSVAQAALSERWPLPSDVLLTLRVLSSPPPLSPSTAADDSLPGTGPEDTSRPSAGLRSATDNDPARVPTSSPPVSPTGMADFTVQDIVDCAFACRQPTSEAAAHALARQQRAIVDELRQRGMITELLRCAANWRSRRLVVDAFYASTTSEAAATALASPYDAIASVRELLFPPSSSPPSPSSATSPSSAPSPPPWRVALEAFPLLFARCVREGAACASFLNSGVASRGEVYGAVCTLLNSVGERAAGHTSATWGHVGGAAPSRFPGAGREEDDAAVVAEDVEVLWRAVACLIRGLQGWLRTQPKAVKEALLTSVAAALEATVSVQLRLAPPPPPSHSSAVEKEWTAGGGLSSKTATAVRAAVESLCSPLPSHAPQVRFIGLGLFARVALSLDALDALRRGAAGGELGLTNGLVQCLLLCLGDARYIQSMEEGRLPWWQPTDSPLLRFLSAPPLARAEGALSLLKTAYARRWFRVTSTHLHSLLSGLQSISIVRTWQQALWCVESAEKELHILPDDRTMTILLLNLSQDSWQRAFSILRYYGGSVGALDGRTPSGRGRGRGGRPGASSRSGSATAATASTRRGPPPPTVMRDLHLISVKHGAWEVTLRLMSQLLDLERSAPVRADRGRPKPFPAYVGYMNYLYSLYAAGIGGQGRLCASLFASLADISGRRGEASPYNAVTVAVVAVSLLDNGHYAEALTFANAVLGEALLSCATTRGSGSAERTAKGDGGRELSAAGKAMAHALKLLAMLHLWEGAPAQANVTAADLVLLMNSLGQQRPIEEVADGSGQPASGEAVPPEKCADTLRRVLHDAVTLECLCGMSHLHAPIRLVFDVIAGPGAYEAAAATEPTLETRQVKYQEGSTGDGNSVRRALYIPPSHCIEQSKWLARSLGRLVKDSETRLESEEDGTSSVAALTWEATQAIAESAQNAGVALEYATASLL